MCLISIIGCGYIGLSLIKVFQKKFQIIGYDISKKRINYLNKHHMYSNVIYTSDEYLLNYSDIYIIAVPTNIIKTNDKHTTNKNNINNNNIQLNLNHLHNVKTLLKKYIKPKNIIILESSIYIGGTRELFSDFLKDGIYIGYSPERISPNDHEDCQTIPKIISGLNNISLKKINKLYSQVINTLIPVSTTETAELCKLYENCFRVINIAYVNEIANLSNQYNINFQEVITATKTKPFGFMSFKPGFGIGGNCLPHNPYYLMHNVINSSETLPILNNSINYLNNLPLFKVKNFLKFHKILIIGTGYKLGESSTYLSPLTRIYYELQKYNKKVIIINRINFKLQFLKKFDCIIIGHQFDLESNFILNTYKLNNYGKVFTF